MFTKYSSISNISIKELEKVLKSEYVDKKWYVTEKIHGSNLSIVVDRNEEKIAKRTSIIGNTDNFFNVSKKEDILKSYGRKIFEEIKNTITDIDVNYISIFGEWYGGYYPHKDVTPIPGIKRIQKGIAYSNDIHFTPFDILVNGEIFLNKEETFNLFHNIGQDNDIILLDILFEGTLKECFNYDINFNSTIPSKTGMPELEPNLVEGIVIKYSGRREKKTLENKSFKKKNQKFSERQKVKKHNPTKELKPEELQYIDFCKSCVTMNRVQNVISKMGDVSFKEFGNIMKNTVEDIHEEAKNEIPNIYSKLDKKERRNANSFISRPLANITRNMLTGVEDE